MAGKSKQCHYQGDFLLRRRELLPVAAVQMSLCGQCRLFVFKTSEPYPDLSNDWQTLCLPKEEI